LAYYSEDLIDEIMATTDIVQVVNEYVPLKKRGVNHIGLCPFHKEKTPSFTVSQDKQIYKCFGCGQGGTVIQFISKMENLDFRETLEVLSEKAGIDLKRFEVNTGRGFSRDNTDDKEKVFNINKEAARYFHEALIEETSKSNSLLKEYLNKRNLDSNVVIKFGLGYGAKDIESLTQHLNKLGYKESEILMSGVVAKNTNGRIYENFAGRLIFPIFDIRDRVIGFGGRVLDNSLPKYVNSPENVVYHKGRNLYGLNIAKRESLKYLILVEGYMDTVALQKNKISSVVASLGTALTEEQAKLMGKYTDTVIIAYDQDDAGKAAIIRAIDILVKVKENLKVKVLKLEPDDTKDPDEYINKYGYERFEECVKKSISYVEYKIEVLEKKLDKTSFESKVEFLTAVARILSEIENDIEREMYIEKIAIKYKIAKEVLNSEINKKIKKSDDKKHIAVDISKMIKKKESSMNIRRRQEEYIIALMLNKDKKIYKEIVSKFKSDIIENDDIKKIYKEIEKLAEKEDITKVNFASKIQDEEMLKLITQIMCIDISEYDKLKLVSDLEVWFKKYKLTKRREEILARMNDDVGIDERKCLDTELGQIIIKLSQLK